MIIVGVDLSLTSTGVAIVDNTGPDLRIDLHRIRTAGRADATLAERSRRLADIVNQISALIPPLDDALLVVEGPSYGQAAQRGQHDRSGLWWLLVDTFSPYLPIVEVPPTVRAKYATGKGNATKDAVLAAAITRYPMAEITGNDTADALLLAAMGARHNGQPIETGLPLTHLAALHSVTWPAP